MTAAVLLAAGRSERMGSNKLLMDIGGLTALERSLRALMDVKRIERIVIVTSRQTEACAREAAKGSPRCIFADGGETRCQSAYNGLKALQGQAVDVVAIHDAARCMVRREDIEATLDSAERFGSGVAGMKAVDTVKIESADGLYTPDRNRVWIVQTPQAFSYSAVMAAYERAIDEGWVATDDAEFVERAFGGVRMVECGPHNMKLTLPGDEDKARAILEDESCPLRIGFGEDAHRLERGRKLILGGVRVESDRGLLGHSDADALAHALADAVLGALALGDIGAHFPDTDERYRDADSVALLALVFKMAKERGYRLLNADSTITCQSPRLAPYISLMRENIAAALETDLSRVSVKATTTERMGYEGRGEGITARAVVLLGRR